MNNSVYAILMNSWSNLDVLRLHKTGSWANWDDTITHIPCKHRPATESLVPNINM